MRYRLSQAFNAALERPEVLEQLARQGFQGHGATPEELAAIVREQLDLWARVIREAKIPTG